jgi:Predicted hydrolases of HD superfamily
MSSHPFFALISRMSNIARWSLMRNSRVENVQEHSHMVAVLAHALAVIRRDVFGGAIDPGAVAAAALYHDAPEILTGDLPTPVKYFNPEIQAAYRAVEEISATRLLAMLPEELQASYRPLLVEGEQSTAVHALVKAADKLAAYIKCVEELKAGNSEFRTAAAQTLRILEDNPLPEVAYFLEHFSQSFSLTLDDLHTL